MTASKDREAKKLKQQGLLDEAIAAYRKAIEVNPSFYSYHHELGEVLAEKGEWFEAIASYQKAIELNPKSAWSHHNLAEAFSQIGKHGKAIASYRQAIELNPKYAGFYHSLGEAFHEQGKLNKAVNCYSKALEINHNFSTAYVNLAQVFIKQGKLEQAANKLEKAKEITPDSAEIYKQLADVYSVKGNFKKAVLSYQKAIEIRPLAAKEGDRLQSAEGQTKAELEETKSKLTETEVLLDLSLEQLAQTHEVLNESLEKHRQSEEILNRYKAQLEPNQTEPQELQEKLHRTEKVLERSLKQLDETEAVLNICLEKVEGKIMPTTISETVAPQQLQGELIETKSLLERSLQQISEYEALLDRSLELLSQKKKSLNLSPEKLDDKETILPVKADDVEGNNPEKKSLKITWIVRQFEDINGSLYSPTASTRYRALIPVQKLIESGEHEVNLVVPEQVLNNGTFNQKLLEVDVVAICKVFSGIGLKIAKAARKAGAKVIVDYCDNQFNNVKHYKSMAKWADVITTTNDYMARIIREHTKKDSLVVGDPYEFEYKKPRFQPEKKLLKLLWFGTQGNFISLISLLPELAKLNEERPLQLHVVTKRDKNLINTLDGSKINYIFQEWSIPQLQKALSNCDLVIIPSFIDSKNKKSVKSANRLIESMVAGRMVVAYPLFSYKEFEEYACLSENIVEGISWVLQNQDSITERIKGGQAYIADRYSPDKIARSWEELFMKATADSKGKVMKAKRPVKLNLGCGNKILKGYTNVDVVQTRQGKKPDVICDIRRLNVFKDNHADEILAVHVAEHFWRWEVGEILSEWVRVLKLGGKLVLECPNILTASSEIIKNPSLVSPGQESAMTMWVLYGDPQWKDPLMCHRWGYTPESLAALMGEIGLVNVRQEPARYKAREPRDMRIVGEKPQSWVNTRPQSETLGSLSGSVSSTPVEEAIALYQSGNCTQAQSLCYKILETQPDNSEVLLLLGKIDYQLKKAGKTPVQDPGTAYHFWYYDTKVWKTTSWAGIRTLKSPSDMWNYQEIISSLQPSFIVEFGARFGGSALFFAALMKQISPRPKVFSVDIDLGSVSEVTKQEPTIELMEASSASPEVAKRITELRQEYPGPLFAILDSDHTKAHVLKEMLMLRPLLKAGDYVIVEDSNINGHPVRPGWGDGPFEAVEEYFQQYPDDYEKDLAREHKFGFTFATGGFLIRK